MCIYLGLNVDNRYHSLSSSISLCLSNARTGRPWYLVVVQICPLGENCQSLKYEQYDQMVPVVADRNKLWTPRSWFLHKTFSHNNVIVELILHLYFDFLQMHIEIDTVYLFSQMHDEQQRLAHAQRWVLLGLKDRSLYWLQKFPPFSDTKRKNPRLTGTVKLALVEGKRAS